MVFFSLLLEEIPYISWMNIHFYFCWIKGSIDFRLNFTFSMKFSFQHHCISTNTIFKSDILKCNHKHTEILWVFFSVFWINDHLLESYCQNHHWNLHIVNSQFTFWRTSFWHFFCDFKKYSELKNIVEWHWFNALHWFKVF